MGEFATGQSLSRLEDLRLLRGQGRFVDDVTFPNQAHGYVLRSPHAHADIRSVDATAARSAPGVLAVLTGADCEAQELRPIPHIGPPVKRRDGDAPFVPPFTPVAVDRARFVGEAVAFVVAETVAQAKDAAELIDVDYDPLPAATSTADALSPDTPVIWAENGTNECFVHEIGDRAATDDAFAAAAHVVRQRLNISRVLANAMENRGCLAHYDGNADHYTLWAPVQHPFVVRRLLAERFLGVPELQIRVMTEDVGGSFGIKANLYPEYLLSIWASKRLGRPGEMDRRAQRGPHQRLPRARQCFRRRARPRRRRDVPRLSPQDAGQPRRLSVAAGAPGRRPTISARCPASIARRRRMSEVTGVFANTHPTAPYRGAGRPEAAYVIERAD